MQKSLTRLFTAVLMAALLISASIMSVSAAEVNCNGHDGWTKISGATFIDKAGYYYLTGDILSGVTSGCDNSNDNGSTITVRADSNAEVVICLNGYGIKAADATNALRIATGKVTLCNCQEQAQDDSTLGNGIVGIGTTRAVQIGTNSATTPIAQLTMNKNVHIDSSGTAVAKKNQGIQVSGDGLLTMNAGSSISNNYLNGKAVDLMSGRFIMNGGEINNNTAEAMVEMTVANFDFMKEVEPTFTMNGGTISGNTATNAANVLVKAGSFTMNAGSTISGNTGRGVSINTSTYSNMAVPAVIVCDSPMVLINRLFTHRMGLNR